MNTDLVSATASALISLNQDRGRAMTRGQDWMETLKLELIDALGLVYRIDWQTARDNVDAELEAAEDPVGLLEELVLRHRMAVALYDAEALRDAMVQV